MDEIKAPGVGEKTMEKLHILADAAKYDVACTSSGVDRKGQQGMLGNASAAGICHSFSADGRCISLLKILMTLQMLIFQEKFVFVIIIFISLQRQSPPRFP